jgi:glucose/arabinose dehydrogenase
MLGEVVGVAAMAAVLAPAVAPATPLADPIRRVIHPGNIRIRLEPVAVGLTAPNWGTAAPGEPGRLYVSDQDGVVWVVDLTTGDVRAFLDVRARLVPLGAFGPNSFDERGLLGIAFHSGYQASGRFYTYTSEPVNGRADFSTVPDGTADHQSVITEWRVATPGAPDAVVDPTSARVLLRIDEPQFNHNAGALNFGPDGLLYVALGDGGGADDQDGEPFFGGPVVGHGPAGNGQNPATVLGKILRIDPEGRDSANGAYGVPGDNPFVARPPFLPEILALGFRNPFRFSFDRATGALYAADVGQNSVEEVNVVDAGANYGWRVREGSFAFDPNGLEPGFVTRIGSEAPLGLHGPIAEYDHDEGIAIVGGFVYRGTRIPKLVGRYVCGDFARTFANDGRLFFSRRRELVRDGRTRRTRLAEFELDGPDALGLSVLGFGEDAGGELYVLANATGIPFGTTGVVLRIAPGL